MTTFSSLDAVIGLPTDRSQAFTNYRWLRWERLSFSYLQLDSGNDTKRCSRYGVDRVWRVVSHLFIPTLPSLSSLTAGQALAKRIEWKLASGGLWGERNALSDGNQRSHWTGWESPFCSLSKEFDNPDQNEWVHFFPSCIIQIVRLSFFSLPIDFHTTRLQPTRIHPQWQPQCTLNCHLPQRQ